jgi:hypothetical protein
MLKHFVFNKTAYIGISDAPEHLSVSEGYLHGTQPIYVF